MQFSRCKCDRPEKTGRSQGRFAPQTTDCSKLFETRLLTQLVSKIISRVTGCFATCYKDSFSGCISLRDMQRGDKGIRTLDPLLARQVLSQLSYAPKVPAATCSPMPLPA